MKHMKKAIIIGCPGSGKSTFARALHERTGLPVYHLDMMFWNADRTIVDGEIFRERMNEVLQKEEWILDGNYGSTMELRMAACETVFFLDYPLEVCLAGVAARKGKPRPDMPWAERVDDVPDEEFMGFIRGFEKNNRPQITELLEKYSQKDIIVFHSREEAQAYLAPIEDAIARVQRMEQLLDEITEALCQEKSGEALSCGRHPGEIQSCREQAAGKIFCHSQWKEQIRELTAYYEGGLWMQDYCRDERGEFPADLKRGVLSEDAVYDLLEELDDRRIRQAIKEDIPRIAEILVFTKRVNFRPIFQNDDYSFGELTVFNVAKEWEEDPARLGQTWVYDDGTVKGLIWILDREIVMLYVDHFFQNQGIGSELIRFAIEEKNANWLWALEKNVGALRFYERHGFTFRGEKKLEEDTTEYLWKLERNC